MNTEIKCPTCSKVSRVASEHIGKKARCPKCDTTFVLSAATPPEQGNQAAPLPFAAPVDEVVTAEVVQSARFSSGPPPTAAQLSAHSQPGVIVSNSPQVAEADTCMRTGAIHTMKGIQDILEVFDDRVTITPKGVLGFLNKGIKGTKEIPYSSIVAVQFKEAGAVFSGYIQFTIPGGNESRGGILAATKDENTFMFAQTKNNAQARQIKEFIDAAIHRLRAAQTTPATTNLSAELQGLAKLKEQGILSAEEFQAAKRRLLG